MITVLGLDGGPLAVVARERLEAADLVVGAARHLAAVPLSPGVKQVVMGDLGAALDAVDACAAPPGRAGPARSEGRVVVLASGDPGFFGIVRVLRERGQSPEVLPAVSAVALAFARAGISWDDAVVVSAHGRELRRAVNVCRARRKVAVLTGPGAGPAELARELAPFTPRALVVCENLGGEDERVTWSRLGEATTRSWRDPNVVLVLDESHAGPTRPGWIAGGEPGPAEWALPEDAFAHRNSMITKAEVRALVLAKLGPRLGDLVWDVGAGSGSVAVECARHGAAVIAVERDPGDCERIRRNVRAHGVKVMVSRGEAPGALEPLPDPDTVFVGGGGPVVVSACAARRPRALVVALAAIDRVPPVLGILRDAGYAVEGVQLQTARLTALPDETSRLAAANPVFVVWGRTASVGGQAS
jgi:precorrin-6Y C5,15-methyltransferase (decarboxylating)